MALMTAYGAGLRVSEVCRLRVEDIDGKRKLIHVRLGKGGKGRYVMLGDRLLQRLGAQLGLTAVLHTWTRDLRFHPHLHCIVMGGGLSDDGQWKSTKRDYIFPLAVLSKLFPGKMVAILNDAYRDGRLDVSGVDAFVGVPDEDAAWRRLRKKLFATKWVSYGKAALRRPRIGLPVPRASTCARPRPPEAHTFGPKRPVGETLAVLGAQ